MRISAGVLLLIPAIAFASGPFDGTWKTRVDSMKQSGKPDTFDITQGSYHCASCVPEIRIKADGSDQSVTGHDYYDSVAVRIVNPTSIEIINKRAGKPAAVMTYTVSDGGAMLTAKFTDYTGAQPVSGTVTEKRVGAAPAGAHAVSGSWQTDKLLDMADAGRAVTYAMSADALSMNWNGQSYQAKFDGKQYPVTGDPGNTQVVLKKINTRTVHETDYRQGKVVDEIDLVAAGDGKSMVVTDKDVAHAQTTSMILDKQP